MYEFLNDVLIALYIVACAYILVKSYVSSTLGMILVVFSIWKDLSAEEIFKRCLLKIHLPLLVSGVFSRLSLNIMKNLYNTQTSFYRELLANEKVLIFWYMAIVHLIIVCVVFRGVTVFSQKVDDIDRDKCDLEENNEWQN